MKIEFKTAIILILTLIVGMILGALIYGTVMRSHVKQTALRLRTPGGFIRRMEMVMDLDESQRDRVHEILLNHHEKMVQLGFEVRVMMDSLQKELEPILTKEQMNRLKKGPFLRKERPPGGPPYWQMRSWMRRRPPMIPDSTNSDFDVR